MCVNVPTSFTSAQSFHSEPDTYSQCLLLAANSCHLLTAALLLFASVAISNRFCPLQPIPASSHIICTASLDSIEGRKTWGTATVRDRPDGVKYAAGKALFVIPKKHPLNTSADGTAEEDRAHAAGKHSLWYQVLAGQHLRSCKQAKLAVKECTVCGSDTMLDTDLLEFAVFPIFGPCIYATLAAYCLQVKEHRQKVV